MVLDDAWFLYDIARTIEAISYRYRLHTFDAQNHAVTASLFGTQENSVL